MNYLFPRCYMRAQWNFMHAIKDILANEVGTKQTMGHGHCNAFCILANILDITRFIRW